VFERFKGGTQIQQIQLIIGAVCVIGLLLAAIWFAFFRTQYRPLFSDLRPEDASAIVAELGKKKIPYHLGNGGSAVLVPADMVDGARLDVMGEEGLARGTVGFELFNKSDMGLTDFAQKINYQRALQGELARTIMTFDGVDSVRVHLSLGEDRIFRDDQIAPKASITIRMKRSATLTQEVAASIKRMVAGAVPKLEAEHVVVLDEHGQTIAAGRASPAPEINDPAPTEKRAIEYFYEARIRSAISEIEPSARVTVSIAAGVVDNTTRRQRLAEWEPKTRDFPLQITILSTAALPTDAQEKLRDMTLKAVTASEPLVDFITFEVGEAVVTDRVHTRRPAFVSRENNLLAPDTGRADVSVWFFAGGSMLFLFGGLLFIRQLFRPRRLSKRKQHVFSARLRAALNEGGNSVAST
jgi:flagellar M-ring protein FliF